MSVRARADALRTRIDAAARAAGRAPGQVRLIGVAKTRAPGEVAAAVAEGLADIGENYLDESLPAIAAVAAVGLACCWHFIGHLQGNKTRAVAAHYDWVHTLDRARIADRLSAQRDPARPPLQVLIQTNFDHEASKSGVTDEAALLELARAVLALPNLRLRGLMTIPAPSADPAAAFTRTATALANLRAALRADGHAAHADALDTLSMGMSDDFEAAVAAGSTMVRIGTALFGPRPARQAQPPAVAAADSSPPTHPT
jgi:hypothetical protein